LKVTVVTRHGSLIEFLLKKGVVKEGEYEVISHASPEAVRGKEVIGVLPHSLSCLTTSFTEVVLALPPEKRGKELTLEDIEKFSKGLKTYKVTAL